MDINTNYTQPVVHRQDVFLRETPAEELDQAIAQDVYEPSRQEETIDDITYKPNHAQINQMKADFASIQRRFLNSVQDMLTKQGKQVAIGEGMWKVLDEGDYEVDEETQAAAKEAISEDGYWGVKQTSTRLITFAKALVGGDPSRAEEMRSAFLKGYEEAAKAWGGELPELSQQTRDATMKLFDEWAQEAQTEA